MIYIRTDADEKAATGHVMRCLTIGKQLEEMGEPVLFLFREPDSVKVLDGRMQYRMLDIPRGEIQEEISLIAEILKKDKVAKLILDSYEFDAEYMGKLKDYARIITFDDMFQEKLPADVLINYNLYASSYDYAKRYGREQTLLLLGSDYVPLREEFLEREVQIREQVSSIRLICGGGDRYHILPRMLEKFCERGLQGKYQLLAVAGALNQEKETLKSFERQWKNITIYENVKNLASLMEQVDLTVSAASTVLYECCCMGRPTIFFTMADNQKEDAAVFREGGMMRYAGDIRENMEQAVERIIEQIEELAKDARARKNMALQMAQKVDGKGARRIAQAIVEIAPDKDG